MKKGCPPKRKEPVAVAKKPIYCKVSFWVLLICAVLLVGFIGWLVIPRNTDVSDALDACIVSTIRAEHHSDHTDGKYPAVAYTPFCVKERRDATTVYGVALYREYTRTTQGDLKLWGVAHRPFVITAEQAEDGSYTATDCRWTQDGSNYRSSIRKMFPMRFWNKAGNIQRLYGAHDAACAADAAISIRPEDEYTVMISEREDVWVVYQAAGQYCYIVAEGAYSADGTYAFEGNTMVFSSGDRKAVFTMDGNDFIYDSKASKNIPKEWEVKYERPFLSDGTRFRPEVPMDEQQTDEENILDATHLSFVGKVTQIEGTALLMECADTPQFNSGVWVEVGALTFTPEIGAEYVVTYEDLVMPSLPPRITAVSIKPIES